jgi:hypothetical protein
MALFNIKGIVKTVGPEQQISQSFSKRELIVNETVGQRDQPIMFEATQDRMSLLDGLKPGEEVNVSFYINGREWTAKDGTVRHFVSLSVNSVEKVAATPAAPSVGPPPITEEIIPDDLEEDDLPF